MNTSIAPQVFLNRDHYNGYCCQMSIDLIQKAHSNNSFPSRFKFLTLLVKSPYNFLYKIYELSLHILDHLFIELKKDKNNFTKDKCIKIIDVTVKSLIFVIKESVLRIYATTIGIIFAEKGMAAFLLSEQQNKKNYMLWKDFFTQGKEDKHLKIYFSQCEIVPSTAIDLLGYDSAIQLKNKSTSKQDKEEATKQDQDKELIISTFKRIINELPHIERESDKGSRFLRKIFSYPNTKEHLRMTPFIKDLVPLNATHQTPNLVLIKSLSSSKLDELEIIFKHFNYNIEYEVLNNKSFKISIDAKKDLSTLDCLFNQQRFGTAKYPCSKDSILLNSKMQVYNIEPDHT